MQDYGFASIPAIKQYLKAAQACSVDCAPLLERAGIDTALLADNNKRVPGVAMERLLALLITASGDPCFGLHSAQFVEPASYSVTGYLSMNCSTLRELLATIPVYEKIVGDMGVSTTEFHGNDVLQRWDCRFANALARRHEVENVLASWHTYTRNFLHFDVRLERSIWFEHAAPQAPGLLDNYSRVFECEVLFDQPASGIYFPQHLLDLPIPQADARLLRTLRDHADDVLAEVDAAQAVTDKVKNLLRPLLREQVPSGERIAQALGMSSRTLQRKLSDEGKQYKDVLNELRLELALHYLQHTELSLENIARELGYAEARSFYRSFKQWTGRTAGSYRAS